MKRINALQGLRALAFIFIFSSHSNIRCFSAGGPAGVSVFFILSGFLMVCSYYETNRVEFGLLSSLEFAIHKIKRLYPLHIITIFFSLWIWLYNAQTKINDFVVLDIGKKVALNLLLLQSWIPNQYVYFSLNPVSWYLSTAFFYILCFLSFYWL